MSIARLVGRARWIFGDIMSPCSLQNAGISFFRLPFLLAHHVKAQSFISNRRPRSQYLPQSIVDLNADYPSSQLVCGQKGVLEMGFRAFSKCRQQATLGYNQHAIADQTQTEGGKSELNTDEDSDNQVEGPPHKCDSCGKVFQTKTRLQTHLRKKVCAQDRFCCQYCDRRFRSAYDLREHEKTHTIERPFACTICSKSYTRISALQQHMRKSHHALHSAEEQQQYDCKQCSKSFRTAERLASHVKRRHWVSCKFCDMSFETKENLKAHVQTHHKSLFKCDSCGKCFKSQGWLDHHLVNEKCNKKPHVCQQCSKTFRSAYDLRKHEMSKHTGEKQYPCPNCDARFVTSYRLQEHLQHQRCDPVKKKSVQVKNNPSKATLKTTAKKSKKKKGKKKCETCGATFNTIRQIQSHVCLGF